MSDLQPRSQTRRSLCSFETGSASRPLAPVPFVHQQFRVLHSFDRGKSKPLIQPKYQAVPIGSPQRAIFTLSPPKPLLFRSCSEGLHIGDELFRLVLSYSLASESRHVRRFCSFLSFQDRLYLFVFRQIGIVKFVRFCL